MILKCVYDFKRPVENEKKIYKKTFNKNFEKIKF